MSNIQRSISSFRTRKEDANEVNVAHEATNGILPPSDRFFIRLFIRLPWFSSMCVWSLRSFPRLVVHFKFFHKLAHLVSAPYLYFQLDKPAQQKLAEKWGL